MKDRKRLQFPILALITFTALIAIAFALLRIVLPYEGVLATETPKYVPYVTILMYAVCGGAIGFAIAAIRSKRLMRGAIVGALLPLIYFAMMWTVLNLR
jgi:hypothetical protein